MIFKVWLVFCITSIVASMTPGPAVLLITSQGARSGVRGSFFGALGICTANIFYFILSSLGLAAALHSATTLFFIVKLCGAGYLIVIGVQNILSSFKNPGSLVMPMNKRPAGQQNTYLQAFATQISNPKAILFFTALVPQFINPGGNIPFQFSLLAATDVTPEIFILTGYGWLGARGGKMMQENPSLASWIDRVSGAILIAIGLRLIFFQEWKI
ncbi:MAG: LysE family translocator [Bacteroidota bacterium]